MNENPNVTRIKKDIEEMTYKNQMLEDLKNPFTVFGLVVLLAFIIGFWFFADDYTHEAWLWVCRFLAPLILIGWNVGNAIYAKITRKRLQENLDMLSDTETGEKGESQ